MGGPLVRTPAPGWRYPCMADQASRTTSKTPSYIPVDITTLTPEEINQLWRNFFTLWHQKYGDASIRTFQAAALAYEAGLPFVPPNNPSAMHGEGKMSGMVQLGMLLRRKHRHVHAGLRLICDRVEEGWSAKTPRSTYHVEPKDEPRSAKTAAGNLTPFNKVIGDNEEDDQFGDPSTYSNYTGSSLRNPEQIPAEFTYRGKIEGWE